MSFLEPLFLLAMPLIGLPILIHLLNQRRHKTAPWAARDFVLQASNMGRGMANMRHWIVLALRTLAIAALIFAISRPLASRIPGLSFLGTQRTQMVVMDRSPSMAIRDSETGLTWRESVLNQLQHHLQTVGGRKYLVHSLSNEFVDIQQSDLVGMLETEVTDTQANLPELIERTLQHIETQAIGPTDIWVCTDWQASDWRLDSGRWNRIREQLESSSEIKLHFLTPQDQDEFNLAISASNVNLVREGDKHFLYLDFSIQQTSGQIQQRKIPVQVSIANNERNVEVEMVADNFQYQQLKVEVSPTSLTGGGVIRLPHDNNDNDNQFYFSYAPSPERNSVIVSDHQEVADLLELVCSTPFDSKNKFNCQVLPVNGQSQIAWQNTALLVWHAPLPTGVVADQLAQFVADGGNVIFLPTETIGTQSELFGVRWGEWEAKLEAEQSSNGLDPQASSLVSFQDNSASQPFQVAQWRTEDDLLATDESGRQLPLKSISCTRRCNIFSESAAVLASFEDGRPFLVRAITDSGGVYFLSTTPDEATSTFTHDGIALYVMLHRALEQGTAALAGKKQLDTADRFLTEPHIQSQRWKSLEFNERSVAEDQRAFYAGVYQADDQIIAINRPVSEDNTGAVEKAEITELLGEDSFDLISTAANSLSGLTNEIWKLFIIAMVIALIAEGWYSLPAKKKPLSLPTEAIA